MEKRHLTLAPVSDRDFARMLRGAEMTEPRSSVSLCPNHTAAHGHGSGAGRYGFRMESARCSAPPTARRCHESCPRQAPERLIASQIKTTEEEIAVLVKDLRVKRAKLAHDKRTLARVKKRDGR